MKLSSEKTGGLVATTDAALTVYLYQEKKQIYVGRGKKAKQERENIIEGIRKPKEGEMLVEKGKG